MHEQVAGRVDGAAEVQRIGLDRQVIANQSEAAEADIRRLEAGIGPAAGGQQAGLAFADQCQKGAVCPETSQTIADLSGGSAEVYTCGRADAEAQRVDQAAFVRHHPSGRAGNVCLGECARGCGAGIGGR